MSGDFLSDSISRLLEKSLSWRNRCHQIIAGNLANLETPYYTRKELNFQEVLKAHLQGRDGIILATTHPQHFPKSGSETGLVRDTEAPVDLDQEMVNLSLNQLGYQTSVTMLRKKLDQLRTVIEGAGK
ncbi:MAG: flagellar basal body rod protein FlgB [Desulfobaccales bacterium]